LTTTFNSYDSLGQPTEIVEGGEGTPRTTKLTYDAAGRQTTKKIEGGGAEVHKTETLYSSTLGLPTVQQLVCESGCTGFDSQATTTTYDELGRAKTYEDADGNKSETTYDIDGRPVKVSDGKGSQTLTYDPASGLATKLEDSGAGTFTAKYDADGNLVERTFPDGLTATTTYNEVDEPTKLAYTKPGSTWYEETLERSVFGRILTNNGTLVDDSYSYDKDGRLREARETPTEGPCITREYSYDADSNRLTRTERKPIMGNECVFSGGTPQEYHYDAADRLTASGLTYDPMGRITKLPAEYAGGHALETSYYSTNMVATQKQNGITNSYELDATGRQRARLQGGGGLEGVEVFHYDGAGDAPAWTERGTTWARDVAGIGGELVAVQESGPGTESKISV
jgi:YD repeat-containing protein